MDLRETTSQLLRSNDVAKWIKLADAYIQAYNKMPSDFVLPAAHKKLKPIIEAFASSTEAFSDYIKALRDANTADEAAYGELHKLYRSISNRGMQVVRRNRHRKAALVLDPAIVAKLGRPTTYKEQLLVAGWLESEVWKHLREDLLSKERSELTSKRISIEDREVILDAFWTDIEKKLAKGQVVLGGHTIDEIVEILQK